MALFTKNKNRAALFGKQTLYDKCCTPEVEECCYLADPLPRPPAPCQECGENIKVKYLVNNVVSLYPIYINTLELPAVIEVIFLNGNLECDATFGKITSDSGDPNISITTYSIDTIGSLQEELIATIQLNTILGPGSYSPSLFFNLCGVNNVLNVDILIESIIP